MQSENGFELVMPAAMAQKAEDLGVKKANMKAFPLFLLAVLAGAYISIGSFFCTIALTGSADMPYGVGRLLAGLVFCIGLILVVVGGAELFTGNTMISIAWASKRVSFMALLRNWVIVYLGNFVGSLGTAALMIVAKQYTYGSGAVGTTALNIAMSKLHLGFAQAISLGILCNTLVCLGVWLSYSGRTTTDKIIAILFPVSAFVAAGFEHSVANMYFIPYAIFINTFDPAFVTGLGDKVNVTGLGWGPFLVNNLLPVTIGNIIGGGFLVGLMYWMIYLRGNKSADTDKK